MASMVEERTKQNLSDGSKGENWAQQRDYLIWRENDDFGKRNRIDGFGRMMVGWGDERW